MSKRKINPEIVMRNKEKERITPQEAEHIKSNVYTRILNLINYNSSVENKGEKRRKNFLQLLFTSPYRYVAPAISVFLIIMVTTLTIYISVSNQNEKNIKNNTHNKVVIAEEVPLDNHSIRVRAEERFVDITGVDYYEAQEVLLEEREENNDTNQRGSLSICMMITDPENNFVDGSKYPNTEFLFPALTNSLEDDDTDFVPETKFTTPLNFNEKKLNSELENASCKTYEDLPLGEYYYRQINELDTEIWHATRYSDEFSLNALTIDDLYEFDSNLFDDDSTNDQNRNKDSDGHIKITSDRLQRQILILNQYKEIETPEEPTPTTTPKEPTNTPTPSESPTPSPTQEPTETPTPTITPVTPTPNTDVEPNQPTPTAEIKPEEKCKHNLEPTKTPDPDTQTPSPCDLLYKYSFHEELITITDPDLIQDTVYKKFGGTNISRHPLVDTSKKLKYQYWYSLNASKFLLTQDDVIKLHLDNQEFVLEYAGGEYAVKEIHETPLPNNYYEYVFQNPEVSFIGSLLNPNNTSSKFVKKDGEVNFEGKKYIMFTDNSEQDTFDENGNIQDASYKIQYLIEPSTFKLSKKIYFFQDKEVYRVEMTESKFSKVIEDVFDADEIAEVPQKQPKPFSWQEYNTPLVDIIDKRKVYYIKELGEITSSIDYALAEKAQQSSALYDSKAFDPTYEPEDDDYSVLVMNLTQSSGVTTEVTTTKPEITVDAPFKREFLQTTIMIDSKEITSDLIITEGVEYTLVFQEPESKLWYRVLLFENNPDHINLEFVPLSESDAKKFDQKNL